MNLRRFTNLFLAHFRVNTRNKLALFFSLLFPLMFVGIMGVAFQEGDPGNSTIQIGVINNDNGIPNNAIVFDQHQTQLHDNALSIQFIDLLAEITYEDNQTNIFDITEYNSLDEAEDDLNRRQIKALITLPYDFSLGYMAEMRNHLNLSAFTNNWQSYPSSNYSTQIELDGDPTLLEFSIAEAILDEVVKSYFAFGTVDSGISLNVDQRNTDGYSVFDYTVPGLVIFALISNTATVASVALGDVESNLLKRLRLSKMKKWEYTVSLISSQLLMAFIQIPIMFGAAFLFGFPISIKILYAFVFAIFVSLSMTGLGVLLAGLVSNANAVGGLSAIVTTPMAFLAGAFFSVPNPKIIPAGSILGDHSIGIFDLLAPRMAIDGLRLVLLNDFSFTEVLFEFSVLIVLSIIYLVVGIKAYNRKHLSTN